MGTQQFRDRGGSVLLVASQWMVERAVRMVKLDALANVRIVGSAP